MQNELTRIEIDDLADQLSAVGQAVVELHRARVAIAQLTPEQRSELATTFGEHLAIIDSIPAHDDADTDMGESE